MNIPVDKIRDVIGSGGKVIREIVEKTGAKINIDDDGTIKIASSSGKEIEAAKKWIHSIVAEPEVGVIYEGTVVKVADFGAFVNFFGPKDGLVHISQLAPKRVAKTSDVVKEGEKVWVKLLGFDERGKVRLSMKVVDQETGKEIKPARRILGARTNACAESGSEYSENPARRRRRNRGHDHQPLQGIQQPPRHHHRFSERCRNRLALHLRGRSGRPRALYSGKRNRGAVARQPRCHPDVLSDERRAR
jgi:predicted RNA-binding protein with RPS1 domain